MLTSSTLPNVRRTALMAVVLMAAGQASAAPINGGVEVAICATVPWCDPGCADSRGASGAPDMANNGLMALILARMCAMSSFVA